VTSCHHGVSGAAFHGFGILGCDIPHYEKQSQFLLRANALRATLHQRCDRMLCECPGRSASANYSIQAAVPIWTLPHSTCRRRSVVARIDCVSWGACGMSHLPLNGTFLQWTDNAGSSRLAEHEPNPGETSQRRRTYPESSLDDEGAGAIRNFLSSKNRITFFKEAQMINLSGFPSSQFSMVQLSNEWEVVSF
jgi:hypothetical protein